MRYALFIKSIQTSYNNCEQTLIRLLHNTALAVLCNSLKSGVMTYDKEKQEKRGAVSI